MSMTSGLKKLVLGTIQLTDEVKRLNSDVSSLKIDIRTMDRRLSQLEGSYNTMMALTGHSGTVTTLLDDKS